MTNNDDTLKPGRIGSGTKIHLIHVSVTGRIGGAACGLDYNSKMTVVTRRKPPRGKDESGKMKDETMGFLVFCFPLSVFSPPLRMALKCGILVL